MALDPYAYARGRVRTKIRQWKTGVVTLTRGADVYTLDARVDGVIAEYLSDTTIRGTDRMVIASPQAILDDAAASIVPRMTDIIKIDGKQHTTVQVKAVPAAGAAAMFHIIIRS
jgi:hypothetical protein